MPDVIPRLISGRYRLVRLLGQGGMGRVWVARDELLSRDVAVKEILAPRGITAADLDRLCERTFREARAIARLNHPNVVRIIDVVPDDGLPCIVMELVPSRSLQQVLHRHGSMPPEQAAKIGLDVLAALRAAHREGLLHRDVKPANVLLADDGRTVLTDFGLVLIAGESSMTASGLLLGSPSFIAPEVVLDEEAGPACDLWSLGATLYTAVEGVPPYAKSTPAATLASLATEAPRPPVRPGVLNDVLEGLLRRDPAQRIDAATAERLLRVAAGDPESPSPSPHSVQGARAVAGRRGRRLLEAGLAVALIAAALLAGRHAVAHDDDAPPAGNAPQAAAPLAPSAPAPSVARPSTSATPAPRRSAPTEDPQRPSAPEKTTRVTSKPTSRGGGEPGEGIHGVQEFTVVTFQSRANGRYVTADDEGTSPLIAFPDAVGAWEAWDEIDLGNGDIALRAEINDKYVSADAAASRPLIASESTIGKSEKFHLVHNSDGTVSILARANDKYVTAPAAGTQPLINSQGTIGDAEKFQRSAL